MSKENCAKLNGKGLVHLFDVSYKTNEILRCIRFLIIGTEMIFSYLTILRYLEDWFNFSKTQNFLLFYPLLFH